MSEAKGINDTSLGEYKYDVPEDPEAKKQFDELPLKDRQLTISRETTFKLTFQEMHDLRAMHLKAVDNAQKEIERAQAEKEESLRKVKQWEDEIKKASQDLPELAPFSGIEGIESPIQKKDLETPEQPQADPEQPKGDEPAGDEPTPKE